MPLRARAVSIVVVAGATGVAGVTIALAQSPMPPGFTEVETAGIALTLVAAWSALGQRRPTAASCGLLVVAVCAPIWAGWHEFPPVAQAWLGATPPLSVLCITMAFATLRDGPATVARPAPTGLLGCGACAVAAFLLAGLAVNPALDLDCTRTCMNATPILQGLIGSHLAASLVVALTAASAACGVRFVLAAPAQRAHPERAIGVAAIVITAVAPLAAVTTGTWSTWWLLGPAVGASGVSAVVIAATVRRARRRRWLRLSLEALRVSSTGHAGLDAVAVHYAMPGTDAEVTWVDGEGIPVAERAEVTGAWTLLDRGVPAVRILGQGGDSTVTMHDTLTPAARLTLANAHLTAVSRGRLRQLHESQRRIIEAMDVEARRIERDLHDGAQQRLVSASLYIQLAHTDGDSVGALDDAAAGVREATSGLRRIAHGAFPTLLHTEGLDAALDELWRQGPADVTVRGTAGPALPSAAASAAYAVAAAGVESADAAPVLISVERNGAALRVQVNLTGSPCDDAAITASLVEAADRVGALGGSFGQRAADGGWRIEAVIPCAS